MCGTRWLPEVHVYRVVYFTSLLKSRYIHNVYMYYIGSLRNSRQTCGPKGFKETQFINVGVMEASGGCSLQGSEASALVLEL